MCIYLSNFYIIAIGRPLARSKWLFMHIPCKLHVLPFRFTYMGKEVTFLPSISPQTSLHRTAREWLFKIGREPALADAGRLRSYDVHPPVGVPPSQLLLATTARPVDRLARGG